MTGSILSPTKTKLENYNLKIVKGKSKNKSKPRKKTVLKKDVKSRIVPNTNSSSLHFSKSMSEMNSLDDYETKLRNLELISQHKGEEIPSTL